MLSNIGGAVDSWLIGTSLFSKIFSNHLEPIGSYFHSGMLEYFQLLACLAVMIFHLELIIKMNELL